jgi:phage terminase small subunit
MSKPLTERELRFVDAFMGDAAGNGTEAARLAGYKGTQPRVLGVQAARLLKKASIQAEIAKRRAALEADGVTTALQRRQILTSIENDSTAHPLARIKAIDVHNKMDGVYVEKHEVGGKDGGPLIVKFGGRYREGGA